MYSVYENYTELDTIFNVLSLCLLFLVSLSVLCLGVELEYLTARVIELECEQRAVEKARKYVNYMV